MEPLIKISSAPFSENPDLRRETLAIFPGAVFKPKTGRFSTAELIEFFKGAEGALVGLDRFDREVIDALPDLKIIAKFGVGLDNIDLEYARARGIAIGWTGGVNRRSVSELSLGMMLGLFRNIFFSGLPLRSGTWAKDGGFQLTGKTVGIVGCGFIGTDLCRLLQPFECRILIHDILDKSDVVSQYGVTQVGLDELIKTADVVSLHVPLTPDTRHLINADRLAAMKPSAYLINTSRGGVVQQSALKAALKAGSIAGAALDVFEEEPPTDLEFLGLPNLWPVAHIGGNAREAVLAMGRAALGHLREHFRVAGSV